MPKKVAKAAQKTAVEAKKTCGLIMPISAREGLPESHWREVRSIIKRSLQSLNLDVGIVSDGEASDIIHKTILQRLYTSTVCVCDISTLNPNVMFELGIRLSFSKPTVIIGDDATPLPFDTTLLRRLPYPRDLRYQKIQRFKVALRNAVAAALEADARGDQTDSLMSVLGPIKVPQLDTQEVPGLQFVMDELKEIKQALSRKVNQRITLNDATLMPVTYDEIHAVLLSYPKDSEQHGIFRQWDTVSSSAKNKLIATLADEIHRTYGGRPVDLSDIDFAIELSNFPANRSKWH